MRLGAKQELFTNMYMLLLIFLHESGYRVRQKHALRCPDCKVGHKDSLHKKSLAQDIVIRKNETGAHILTDTESYTFAGEYWESIGGAWGGRWGDGGHFSLEYGGMK